MRRHRAAVVLVLVGLIAFTAPRLLARSTPLESALELYAAAAYEEALAAFDTVSTTALSVDDQVVVAQHRMLCLMAMGRTADADRAAAHLLTLRPEFVLAAHDASPRVRTMFETARRRVLPAIVRERFVAARKLYDSGALVEARVAFASVSQALADAGLVERDPTLADVRTLADGFLALTAATATAPAATPRVEAATPRVEVATPRVEVALPSSPSEPAPAPVAALPLDGSSASLVAFPRDSSVAWREGESPAARAEADVVQAPVEGPAVVRAMDAAPAVEDATVTPATEAAPATVVPPPSNVAPLIASVAPPEEVPVASPEDATVAAPSPAPAATASSTSPAGAPFTPIDIFTYDWRDKDVTPPSPVAQAVSGWWGSMGEPPAGTPLGAVDVVIDEHGKVVDAKIYLSVNRVYDAVLLGSVGQWRYRPATRGGRPVKYRRISGVVSGR